MYYAVKLISISHSSVEQMSPADPIAIIATQECNPKRINIRVLMDQTKQFSNHAMYFCEIIYSRSNSYFNQSTPLLRAIRYMKEQNLIGFHRSIRKFRCFFLGRITRDNNLHKQIHS